MPAARPRLYLIDGYSNIFRAFYAIRHLSNSKGEPTNAVYGFVQMLRKLLRDEQPDLIGVALDVSRRTVRTEKFEDYKANRAPMPEELRGQIPQIRKVLEAHRIPILEMENYEADDVLGSLAGKAAEEGFDVILVSADKDLMQLVDDHVFLMHTGRNKLYDPALVEEDFGVPPSQVVEVLALKGDSVDNVPGVPGIGEKGAIQLVREYGTVENLLERTEEIKRKSYREGLQDNHELALLSKELVTIHTDLALDFEPERLQHEEPDTEALKELFRELEFFSPVTDYTCISVSSIAGVKIFSLTVTSPTNVYYIQLVAYWIRCRPLCHSGHPISILIEDTRGAPTVHRLASPGVTKIALWHFAFHLPGTMPGAWRIGYRAQTQILTWRWPSRSLVCGMGWSRSSILVIPAMRP